MNQSRILGNEPFYGKQCIGRVITDNQPPSFFFSFLWKKWCYYRWSHPVQIIFTFHFDGNVYCIPP